MKITKSVYLKIINEIGNAPIESGGIIGRKNGIICAFYKDSYTSPLEYRPSVEILNKVIARWAKRNIAFAGIVHSHPNGLAVLSTGDELYAEKIMESAPLSGVLYFPIVTLKNGKVCLTAFGYNGNWEKSEIIII